MLRELSECVGQNLSLDTRGRHGVYSGILEIDETTNPATYILRGKEIVNIGSLTPNPFNTTHRVNEQNEIVTLEAA